MNKIVPVIVSLVLSVTSAAFGSGYRVPVQSVNSTATAAAYLAHTQGADASYFNPANMAWIDDRGAIEADLLFLGQSAMQYEDSQTSADNRSAREETFFFPAIFAVLPDYHHFRAGFSVTQPAVFSRKWQDSSLSGSEDELSMQAVELGISVSYRISQYFSAAGGGRILSSSADMKSNGSFSQNYERERVRSDIDGDALSFGYHLAATAKPFESTELALFYQSRVDLDFEGDARLSVSSGSGEQENYIGDTMFSLHLPAVLALACSNTFFNQLTVEFKFERVFWSEFDRFDINYSTPMGNYVLKSAFDDSRVLNWEDTKNFRLGIQYAINSNFSFMAGLATEQSPVPDESHGFGISDADACLFSAGLRYRSSEKVNFGVAYLYIDRQDRAVSNSEANGIFTGNSSQLLSFSISYLL